MAIIGAGIFVKSELVVLKAIWSQSKFRIWSRSFGTWACVDGSIVGGLEKTDYVFSWRLGADGNDDIIELLMSHQFGLQPVPVVLHLLSCGSGVAVGLQPVPVVVHLYPLFRHIISSLDDSS
ncbi:hypothetical protein QVD17_33375 [Tagetes erecta]|uniref:Uncharacterized protein n=1 Tax=Tagetes erecta TaxID=13708 RepID=A0AAD8JYR3_TARER|nr:hypothetical protein QVD17_33375 [Tagetes erecta]